MQQGTLAAGDSATGLRWLRPGFGFSAEDDRLWALGWPHLKILVPGDATAKQLATSAAFAKAYTAAGPELPEGMAVRALRYYTATPVEDTLVAAVRDDAPLRDDDLPRVLELATRVHRAMHLVYVLEALRSSAEIARGILDALEAAAIESWQRGSLESFGAASIHALHYLMLRCSPEDAGDVRGRLVALADRLAASGLDPIAHRSYGAIRFVLDPQPQGHWFLEFLTPDRAAEIAERLLPVLSTMKPADRVLADPRLAFLGGEPVIEAFARHAKQFHKDHKEALVLGMARCAHPAVVTLMQTIGTPRAKQWLREHAAS